MKLNALCIMSYWNNEDIKINKLQFEKKWAYCIINIK